MSKANHEAARPKVKSVDRALDLFELLAEGSKEFTHAELAERLEIPKSSLSQLLGNLIYRGYVAYEPDGQLYRLGNAFLRISDHMTTRRKLHEIAAPVLEDLKNITGESAMIQEFIGNEGIVTASVMGDQSLVTHMRVGERAPLYTLSGGKVMLASLAEKALEQYLEDIEFVPLTDKTIRNAAELQEDLASVRATGYAYSLEEHKIGVNGIGVPIQLEDGTVVAGLSVVMPAIRHTPEAETRIKKAITSARLHLNLLLEGTDVSFTKE
jgi:DNA-binding IclR family transcriptional regulator